MGNLWQDIRYGIRTLRKSRAFTLAALLTLTLGIGANTVIFSVINAVLLRPLPFPNSQKLANLTEADPTTPTLDSISVSFTKFTAIHDQNKSFESVAAYFPSDRQSGRRKRTRSHPRSPRLARHLPNARHRPSPRTQLSPRRRPTWQSRRSHHHRRFLAQPFRRRSQPGRKTPDARRKECHRSGHPAAQVSLSPTVSRTRNLAAPNLRHHSPHPNTSPFRRRLFGLDRKVATRPKSCRRSSRPEHRQRQLSPAIRQQRRSEVRHAGSRARRKSGRPSASLATGAARRRRLCTADSLRQRRQPPASSRRRPAKRNRHPQGTRSLALAPDPATTQRKPPALTPRRRVGNRTSPRTRPAPPSSHPRRRTPPRASLRRRPRPLCSPSASACWQVWPQEFCLPSRFPVANCTTH